MGTNILKQGILRNPRHLIAGLLFLLGTEQILALDPGKGIFQYNCQTWTRASGLPANGVNAIAQTKDGCLWLGTGHGLVAFDGIEFRTPDPKEWTKLPSTVVRSLSSSRDGGLWFGLDRGAFGLWDGQSVAKSGWGGKNLNVQSIVESSTGDLWIGAETELGHLSREQEYKAILTGATAKDRYDVTALARGSEGRIWFGTVERGLYSWQNGTITKFSEPLLDQMTIRALAEDNQGRIWIGTERGLLCYDSAHHRRPLPFPWYETRALLLDRHGVVWVGTTGGGVVRYSDEPQEPKAGQERNLPASATRLMSTNGLADDFVSALAEDNEGNIWVGTRNGLSELSDVKIPTFGKNEGIAGDVYVSVCASRQGGLWVATDNGLTLFGGSSGNLTRSRVIQSGFNNPYLIRVFESKTGEIYVINGSKDIEILEGTNVVARYPNKDWPSAFSEDAEGVVVCINAELYRVDRKALQPYVFTNQSKPVLEWVYNMETGADGAIWIASDLGIFRVKGGVWKQWGVRQGLADSKVLWVQPGADGVVWAGLETGIARLKDGRISNVRRADGLLGGNIYALVPDDYGCFWVDSDLGLFKVSKQVLSDFCDGARQQVECTAFDGLNAVKSDDKNQQKPSACKTLDGRIWFPTALGVAMVDPSRITTNTIAPQVKISLVRANGKLAKVAEKTRVSPGKGELDVEYAALTFIAPQKVQYRYQLEGYDKAWVDAGHRRSASYTNLRPGTYRFAVIACNADGIWSKSGALLEIEFLPHFYQTGWFYGSVGLAAVIGLFGIYRWRVHQLHVKQRRLQEANDLLESKVSERTAELNYERELFRTLLDSGPDVIYFKDRQSRFIRCSAALAQKCGVARPELLIGKSDFDLFTADHAQEAYDDEQEILRSGQPVVNRVEKETWPDGRVTWVMSFKMPFRNQTGEIVGTFGISKDISAIKEAEAQLERVHRQLLDASHKAGQAEIASSVLHNIGNVLNSVNVSVCLIADRLRDKKADKLGQAVALLGENEPDLTNFVKNDQRGSKLIPYLRELAVHFRVEQLRMVEEVQTLVKNLEHVKEVVAMQQSYASAGGVLENIALVDLVENAITMLSAAYERHSIRVVRRFEPLPTTEVDRHKFLQILVNLLQNSKSACDQGGNAEKVVSVSIQKGENNVACVVVEDNGIGIPPENMTRIFNHGFTTKSDGHGFGLHSAALAAKQMGGSLAAFSQGTGFGAKFVLELPLKTSALPSNSKGEVARIPSMVAEAAAK